MKCFFLFGRPHYLFQKWVQCRRRWIIINPIRTGTVFKCQNPTSIYCWPTACDTVRSLKQPLLNFTCLLGIVLEQLLNNKCCMTYNVSSYCCFPLQYSVPTVRTINDDDVMYRIKSEELSILSCEKSLFHS